ncbi:hypothetical protein SAY86_015936 [Trapa natans]|uniref:Nucleotide-diphospho-sugar transferase domain-containing protein n=1 Tax=Trapa natans TaxID=22666 RepID=A0AAN7QVX7_TRANT|nr:hypothetical protein SAY86_015936 [Trapa natans]
MVGHKDGSLMPDNGRKFWGYRVAIILGVLLCCILALLYTNGLYADDWADRWNELSESRNQVYLMRSHVSSQSEEISELKMQVQSLTEKLRLAESGRDNTQNLLLQAMDERLKVGPFGTVKAVRTNPTIIPNTSANPRLAKLLEEVALRKELIVAISNNKKLDILDIWFTNIKRVGIPNYMVVALDNETAEFCRSKQVPFYQGQPDREIDVISSTGTGAMVSGLKFRFLREILQMGYSVLLSDVDIVFLQNPFHHLYRDSDVESTTDGHDNGTAYGFIDVFDDPVMVWSRLIDTNRIWVYNSGCFYVRPTVAAIELMDRVTSRMIKQPDSWDQEVYNEELFHPSHPGYVGLHAAKRTMDYYLFMNSKVLFKQVRKDAKLLNELKPVMIHVNYHPDKLPRMKAVVDFYVNGNKEALQPFPDGSS